MKKLLFVLMAIVIVKTTVAQNVAINNDGTAADVSAALDIKSTDKGMLVPRMTTAQRTIIASPAKGLLVFDNTTNSFWFYNGTAWAELADQNNSNPGWANSLGNSIHNTNSGNVGIGTATPYTSAILHLNATDKAFMPPSLSTTQMNGITNPIHGMIVYNNELKQPCIYTQYRKTQFPQFQGQNRWEPLNTGPRMIAYGYVDSTHPFCQTHPEYDCGYDIPIVNGSGSFKVNWIGGNNQRHYEVTLNDGLTNFNQDSMLVTVTPLQSLFTFTYLDTITTAGVTRLKISFVSFTNYSFQGWTESGRVRYPFYIRIYDMRKTPFQ